MYTCEKPETYVDWIDVEYGDLMNNTRTAVNPLKLHMCEITFMFYRKILSTKNETNTSISGGISDDIDLYVKIIKPDVVKSNLAFLSTMTFNDELLHRTNISTYVSDGKFKLVTKNILNMKKLQKLKYSNDTKFTFKIEISYSNIDVLLGELNMSILQKMSNIEKMLIEHKEKTH